MADETGARDTGLRREDTDVSLQLNGRPARWRVAPRQSLGAQLREAGATSVHLACEHGVCGACTVLLDGEAVRACLIFAVQADGAEVETLEGADRTGRIADLQEAFVAHAALQCGFCTPGFLLTIDAFLRERPDPSREEIRAALSGNICRCTGYQAIVDAVAAVARSRAGKRV